MACTTFLGDNHVLSDNYLTGGCGGGNSKAIPSSRSASAKVIEGEIAFFTNTSEEVVLDAEYFAFYKGALIIKVPSMGNSGFTFGAILIGPDVDANLVRHEYGHMVQLWETDIITYTACFAMPSIACYWLSEWDVLSWDDYNNRPWEYLADQFGGASREHASWAAPVGEIYWYIIEKARLLP